MKMSQPVIKPENYAPEFTNVIMSSSSNSTKMKYSSAQREDQEFSLSTALERRCVSATRFLNCGKCESCILVQKVREVKQWFFRFGDYSKKRFMLGLLHRIKSISLLKSLTAVLQFTSTKDRTYARARTNPSLDTDIENVSSDHAICTIKMEQVLDSTWEWFTHANYWTKKNFMLSFLQMCEAHLLHVLYKQANTLLAAELKAADSQTEDNSCEATLVTLSEFSYQPHTESEFSFTSRSENSTIDLPLTGETVPVPTLQRTSSASDSTGGAKFLSDELINSVDPMILVNPLSAKAYAGVSQHKDFIRCLPVHLSKMILSMLDMVSLYNALCVSPNWRKLVEEVRQEIKVNQQIKEEVMLMQGSSTHSANPVYANDIDVPVPEVKLGTHEIIYTSDIIETTFKSQLSFQTAYTGISTRKVIMEERNVYCGSYNVLVVDNNEDSNRVMHTDGSNLIAVGSKDRKVHFVDCDTGKETGPVITGHAGSIKCCHLLRDRGMVLSGSYDTSIRCWSTETGKCLKILRGHQDTVNCIAVTENVAATGAMDKHVKIWNLETGKCQKTLKHRSAVLAVALTEDICVSGCESGKVKVWELGSGNLIKILTGHHAAVTAVKFDRWHIITGGKDGYALVWSTVGAYTRCLTALRHHKVITGSADGRIRIWNFLSGQCCRIMRGNSQSDPILSIVASEGRITVNTLNNLLVMNFEKVKWDYTLETDEVTPLVQFKSYSDAKVRSQPYPYVRAQRMRKAGASNRKIIHHNSPIPETCTKYTFQHNNRAPQLPHSARSLSSRSLEKAKQVQNSLKSFDMSSIAANRSSCSCSSQEKSSVVEQSVTSSEMKLLQAQSPHSEDKLKAGKESPSSQFHDLIKKDDDGSCLVRGTPNLCRRISWAFDKPLVPKGQDISLSEMKALLRSQIRMKKCNIIPPDFIYLTVSTIEKSVVNSETNYNTKLNMLDWKPATAAIKKRPTSSPSRIDSRTKVPVEQLGLEIFHAENDTHEPTNPNSVQSVKTKEQIKPQLDVNKESFTTSHVASPVNVSSHSRIHPKSVKTATPTRWVVHPKPVKTATPTKWVVHPVSAVAEEKEQVPLGNLPPAPGSRSSTSLNPSSVSITSPLPHTRTFSQRSKSDLQPSTTQQASITPLLIYAREVKEKVAKLKEQRKNHQAPSQTGPDGQPVGKTSTYNQLMRGHVRFELRTHQQEEEYMHHLQQTNNDTKRKENEELEKKKKAPWLALPAEKSKLVNHATD